MPNTLNKNSIAWCEYLYADISPDDDRCTFMYITNPSITKCKQCIYIRKQEYETKHNGDDEHSSNH